MASADDTSFFRPCPACGGDVHTVASKCKHCGAELRDPPSEGEPEPPTAAPPPSPAPSPTPIAVTGPPTPTPVAGPPPPVTDPRPPAAVTPRAYARPSRWVWLAGATLLLAIGMALGVIIERAGRDERTVMPRPRAATTHTAPLPLVPDPDFDFDADPDFTRPPGGGFSLRITPFSGRQRSGTAGGPEADEFVRQLGGELCSKLTDCADIDPAISMLCTTVAGSIDTDDLTDKIARGECHYDAGAAADCIAGLSRLDCDSGQADPFALMQAVESMLACTEAVSCL